MIPVAIPINQSYIFESDNESHINADELSDLSDVFDDNESVNGLSNNGGTTADSGGGGGGGRSLISLDDIPYDRDVKWINVPTNARPRHSLINPDALRMLKNVDIIASGKANDRAEDKKKGGEPRNRRRELREGGETNAGTRQAEYNRSRHADANATERAHNHSYAHHKQSPREEPTEAGGHARRAHGRRSGKEHTPFAKATPSPAEFSGKSGRRQQSYQQPSSQPMQTSTSLNTSLNQMTTSSDENSNFQLNPCAREFVPSFSFR